MVFQNYIDYDDDVDYDGDNIDHDGDDIDYNDQDINNDDHNSYHEGPINSDAAVTKISSSVASLTI